ncbi:MAG: glycosyltransferase family 2 protein [Actinobacteria bacterium]|nr:glycosyltransferase family 2 protein [Actinomycetota bacterium]
MIVVVPSRGRPDNIAELIEAFDTTCVSTTKLWVCVDDDDPELEEYSRVIHDAYSGFTYLFVEEPSRIGPILNRVVPKATEQDDVVAFMGDDHRPRTVAWDQLYINNLREMGTGVVYGNDLYQGANIPTQVAMTSNIVKATGYFVPPGAKHLYLDNAWADIGRATKLRYLPDVIVEHMHPCAGKGKWDDGYAANNSTETYSEDEAVYNDWKQNVLPDWIEKIRGYTE